MALEAAIYQQDPLIIYGCKDYNCSSFGLENGDHIMTGDQNLIGYWDSPPSSVSPETCAAGGGAAPQAAASRRKRRRSKSLKNKEQMESQRMTHIAVERNRRRQMNDYLAALRSLMPPSYSQRGDQASIVGGAINFVKELEQLLQSLEAYKFSDRPTAATAVVANSNVFSDFFTFPQYSRRLSSNSLIMATDVTAARRSSVADIEVTMVESHANIKILSKRRPKQLLKMVAGFQSICLDILHLNITTVDQSVLYSFSVKVEDECELNTVNDIATAIHEMVGTIQQESSS